MGRLVRFLVEEYRVVPDNTDGESMNVGPSYDQSNSVRRLEFDKSTSVDDSCDELVHVPWLSDIGADDVENLICCSNEVVGRRKGRTASVSIMRKRQSRTG